MPEEDEVSLVVECDHSSAFELRGLGEQSSKESSNSMSQDGVEVVEDHLWKVFGHPTPVLNVLRASDACYSEPGCGSFWQMCHDQSMRHPSLLLKNKEVCEFLLRCPSHNVFYLKVLPFVVK
jgi:hypothetical protein